ncbi:MAG: phage holin [Christensenellales bacterium]|jgi:uncharacterized membrane protein
MNIKNKLRNYGFWLSVISAALMLIQAFGVKVDIPVLREALISVCGLLVMLGIISDPDKGKGYKDK